MPHFIQEGIRSLADHCVIRSKVTRRDYPVGAYIIELLDVIAGFTFLFGSCCFLPKYASDVETFLLGCVLFIIGSLIYVAVCIFCLIESITEKGWNSFDTWENVLYVLGGTIFFVGTILYMPDKAEKCVLEDLTVHTSWWGIAHGTPWTYSCASISQHVNKYDREFIGTVLFGAGSLLFALAAFVNAMGQRRYDLWTHNMLSLITTFYLIGSILFAMGSMCFLPNLGCDDNMLAVGAWMFIVGSIFFLLGSVLSLWRTTHIYSKEGAPDEDAKITLDALRCA